MFIKKLTFLVFLFFGPILLANTEYSSNYFLYEKKPIQFNEAQFNRYVIPQLKAIIQEFYHLLRKLDERSSDLIELKSKTASFYYSWKDFENDCYQENESCHQKLKETYKLGRTLDDLILKMRSERFHLKNSNNFKDADAVANLVKILGEMSAQNYYLLHSLEEFRIVYQTTFSNLFNKEIRFGKSIDNLEFQSKQLLTSLFPDGLKKDLDVLLQFFIIPIEENTLKNKQPLYLIKRLEDLNISWNSFHMKLTKGNYDLPKSQLNTIAVMHNRWNSILKIILK